MEESRIGKNSFDIEVEVDSILAEFIRDPKEE
jgi:hypothetical protein